MHRVATLMGPRTAMFELSVPCEVFGIHRTEIPGWDYVHVVCASGPAEAGQGGLRLSAERGLDALDEADTIVVPPWQPTPGHFDEHRLVAPIRAAEVDRNWSPSAPVDDDVLDRLRAAHDRGARVVSMCAGAFVLAQAGLLDGRRATTHWMFADVLAASYPSVDVDRSVLYVEDERVFTAAGTAAGVDLCLHLVRKDLGVDAANQVARRMVVPPHRDGGQAQYIDAPVPPPAEADPLAPLLDWMVGHLDEPLTVAGMAERAGMSERTFARRFTAATGSTPLQWLLSQRVAHARRLLETSDLSIEQVAGRCGFATAAGLRQHFQRQVGTSPLAYRRTFREAAG